ncbi:MAG TPA: PIG-L family deacetylase [Candidatus Lokiarchaeia archaeon]|nr:PIG-L family deacetylase [Candidatus Lokiarchaeia archaeon]
MSQKTFDLDARPLSCEWIYPRREKEHKIRKVLLICAHPDDADLLAGGLAMRLRARGHKIRFVSATNGNKGHYKMDPISLAKRRFDEGVKAGDHVGAEYGTLDINDGEVWVNDDNLRRVMRCIRDYAPDLVITHRPNDYHRDHRYVGQLVMDASYMLIVPLMYPEYRTSYRDMPVIAYAYDNFDNPPFTPAVILDITDVYERKALGCMAHESQLLEWLPWTYSMENTLPEEYDYNKRREIVETFIQYQFSSAMSKYRKLVKAGYKDRKVRQIEVFEICPYGKQPNLKELKELFPDAIYPNKKEIEANISDIPELQEQVKELKKEIKELKAKLLPDDDVAKNKPKAAKASVKKPAKPQAGEEE